jgi:hypothetical protein
MDLAIDIPLSVQWNADVVVDKVLSLLTARRVSADVAIGTDARFVLMPLRLTPAWFMDVVDCINPRPVPVAMQKEKRA